MTEQMWQLVIGWGPPSVILAAALFMIYKGAFVTKGYVDRVTAAYELLVKTKDEQLAYREQQIAELKAANAALSSKVDKALDTLDSAIRLIEAGPQMPPPTTPTRRART